MKLLLVYGRIVIDLAVFMTLAVLSNNASNSGVPDAGLVYLATAPIMLATLIDVCVVFWLSRNKNQKHSTRKPLYFAVYYTVTGGLAVYALCRFFNVGPPIAASWAGVVGALFLASFYQLGMLQRKPIS